MPPIPGAAAAAAGAGPPPVIPSRDASPIRHLENRFKAAKAAGDVEGLKQLVRQLQARDDLWRKQGLRDLMHKAIRQIEVLERGPRSRHRRRQRPIPVARSHIPVGARASPPRSPSAGRRPMPTAVRGASVLLGKRPGPSAGVMPRPATSMAAAADDAAARARRGRAARAGAADALIGKLQAQLRELREKRRQQQTMVMRLEIDEQIEGIEDKIDEIKRKRPRRNLIESSDEST